MNYSQPYIIFSAELFELSARDNFNRSEELTQTLKDLGIKFTEVTGQYADSAENSVLLAWTVDNERVAQQLCKDFEQECYLVIDANRRGVLRKPDGSFMLELGIATIKTTKPDQDHTKLGPDSYLIFGSV